jgi:hypothetical protein
MKATRSLLVTGLLVGAVVGVGVTMSVRRESTGFAQSSRGDDLATGATAAVA